MDFSTRVIPVLCFVALLCIAAPTFAVDVPILNPDFSWDGGPFTLPSGWNLLGDAGVGEGWDEAHVFFLNVGGVLPQQDAGVYQVVESVPGQRYRLSADCSLGGNSQNYPQIPASIGLSSEGTLRSDLVTWSPGRTEGSWGRLTVETVATGRSIIMLLRQINTNPEFPDIGSARFDNIRLEDLGNAGVPTPTPGPAPTPTPGGWKAPANDPLAAGADYGRIAYSFDGVRTKMKASTALPSQHPNQDFNNYQGTVSDGGATWDVLHESHQPGAILRIWMTGYHRTNGRIRIYLDNTTTPVVDTTITQFMSGWMPRFPRPLSSPNSGGWANYMPMPYRDYCRVQVRDQMDGGLNRFYYQVTYQDYDSAIGMDTFPPTAQPDLGNARRMEAAWSTAGVDSKSALPATGIATGIISLNPGQTVTFWSGSDAGVIRELWIDPPGDTASENTLRNLRLLGLWDGDEDPAIDTPVGIFFGTAYAEKAVRSLMVGMTRTAGYYCFFPMPYHAGAELRLRNDTGSAITGLQYRVVHVDRPGPESGELRFHAEFDSNPNAGAGGLYVPLEVTGRGHFCGIVMGMRSNAGTYHMLEGDEHVFVDGDTEPTIQGTGAEDYFTCGWYFARGPMCFPQYGVTDVLREPNARVSAYRLHVSDFIPFTTSFRFGIEVGESETDPATGDYQAVSYYYLAAENLPTANNLLGTY
jgi:hypothetical protein